MAEKTYSGTQSYHEMLVRAQALSPALTFAMVTLLLEIKIKGGESYQESESIDQRGTHPLHDHFWDVHPSVDSRNPRTIMQDFLTEVFGNYAVRGTRDNCGRDCKIIAETQFVEWLQTKVVVTVDRQAKLVTINL